MFLVLFGSTAIHAVRIQPVFSGVEEDGSPEERAEESYRAAAPKRIRQPHNSRTQIPLLGVALKSSSESTRSAVHGCTQLIDPHEYLHALRI